MMDVKKATFGIACKSCRRLHKKCDKLLPTCTTCKEKGIQCVYVPPKKRKRRDKSSSDEDEAETKNSIASEFISKFDTMCTCPYSHDSIDYQIEKYGWACMEALQLRIYAHGSDDELRRWKSSFSEYPRPDLAELHSKHDRKELLMIADDIYHRSRELLISPRVFQLMATNQRVIKAALCLVSYSIQTQRNIEEAKLIMGSLAIHFEPLKRKRMMTATNRVLDIPDTGLFVYLLYNYYINATTLSYNFENLGKLICALQDLIAETIGGENIAQNFNKIRELITIEKGLPLVLKFVSMCAYVAKREMVLKAPFHENPDMDRSSKKFTMMHLQFFLIQVELASVQDEMTKSLLYNLRLNISNEMTTEANKRLLPTTSLLGKLLQDPIQVHVDYARLILESKEPSLEDLEKVHSMINVDISILECIANRSASTDFEEHIENLKLLLDSLESKRYIMVSKKLLSAQETNEPDALMSLLDEDTLDDWNFFFSNTNSFFYKYSTD